MPMIHCRHFSGYKPCGLSEFCDTSCPKLEIPSQRILIVHLGALGAVLRSTALLPAIKRKFPQSHITWITSNAAAPLLANLPQIDRLLTQDQASILRALRFDRAYCIDKSLEMGGLMRGLRVGKIFGFRVDECSGAILPANLEARELWEIGLSDRLKFFVNKKPETQLVHEALALGEFQRDGYLAELTEEELKKAQLRKHAWANPRQILLGINTGCSDVIPYKKWSLSFHKEVIANLLHKWPLRVVLLGGRSETQRNQKIAEDLPVVLSPTDMEIRDGLVSMQACDLVISPDSLGMHMAIALKKFVIAYFGPTCAHEIDLYDRGVKIVTSAECSPCWKRNCVKEKMCYDRFSLDQILNAIQEGIDWHNSSSKPHFLETCSSAFL